jgi:hypothetical protein
MATLSIVQVIIHAVNVSERPTAKFTSGMVALGCVGANALMRLALHATLLCRRKSCSLWFRNVLSVVYWLLPPTIPIATAWHLLQVCPHISLPWVAAVLGGLLWLISSSFRLVTYFRRGRATAIFDDQSGFILNIQLKRPVSAEPGYFYMRGSRLSPEMQSQAIPMLWWQPNANSVQHFSVLTDGESRTSDHGRFPVQLDGPYREDLHLGKYEAVMFIAQGSAIGRVLPHLLCLTARMVRDKNSKEAGNRWYLDGLFGDKTRKVDLYWQMDRNSDISSVNAYFDELCDYRADSRLQTWIYYPEGVPQDAKLPRSAGKQRWFAFGGDFLRQVSSAIEVQSKRTPGRTIVVSK